MSKQEDTIEILLNVINQLNNGDPVKVSIETHLTWVGQDMQEEESVTTIKITEQR
jgi:hypothetical protein